MKKLFLVALFGAAAASAQSISIGVLGGAPFENVVQSVQTNGISFLPKSSNFTFGPAFQVNLPASLRFEVDALYRPYSFSQTVAAPFVNSAVDVSADQWRFPFLIAYRFNAPVLKPFIDVGLSFDHLANISAAAQSITSGPGQLIRRSNASLVLGAGVDIKIPFVRISGELRYTRQFSDNFQGISNLNQAEFLAGIHF